MTATRWAWRSSRLGLRPVLDPLILLAVSVHIRPFLNESPFKKMKEEGKTGRLLTESFSSGATPRSSSWRCSRHGWPGGGLHTGQFYALFFLTKILGVEADRADLYIAASLALGTPFFVFFGALSDKIGRKKIIMAGCLIAAMIYFPLFKALTNAANPALETALVRTLKRGK
jgi:hypothetical protein